MKNEKKQDVLIDAISGIDEDMIDQNLKKRFLLMHKKGLSKKALLSVVSLAACFCIILTAILIPFLFRDKPDIIPENTNVPVYEGMTVQTEPPVVSLKDTSRSERFIPSASYLASINRNTRRWMTYLSNTLSTSALEVESGTEEENRELPIFGETYYAMPNEDIYIHIHLTNPADYEILSFTLNGVKFSSYMFEVGSDMENLILKYNVGDVSGLQQYTIDAIKYIDGEQIKDVKMKGDRTVDVVVNGGQGPLSIDAEVEFDTLRFSTEWAKDFTGNKEILSLAIYKGDALYRELSPEDHEVTLLDLGTRYLLKATYLEGDTQKTVVHVFDTPRASTGFLTNAKGEIINMGTCQDSILYIDAPIMGSLTDHGAGGTQIKKIYLSKNVTSIVDGAFLSSAKIEKLVISEGLTLIDEYTFSCADIKEIHLPSTITEMRWRALGADYEEGSFVIIYYNGTIAQWQQIKKNTPWGPASYILYCKDGKITGVSKQNPPDEWETVGCYDETITPY